MSKTIEYAIDNTINNKQYCVLQNKSFKRCTNTTTLTQKLRVNQSYLFWKYYRIVNLHDACLWQNKHGVTAFHCFPAQKWKARERSDSTRKQRILLACVTTGACPAVWPSELALIRFVFTIQTNLAVLSPDDSLSPK